MLVTPRPPSGCASTDRTCCFAVLWFVKVYLMSLSALPPNVWGQPAPVGPNTAGSPLMWFRLQSYSAWGFVGYLNAFWETRNENLTSPSGSGPTQTGRGLVLNTAAVMNQLCVVLLKCHCVISVSLWFSGPAPPIRYPACLTDWLRVSDAADKAESWQRSHQIFCDGEQTPPRINKLNHRSFFTAEPTQMPTDTHTLSHTHLQTHYYCTVLLPAAVFSIFPSRASRSRTHRGGFICAAGWRSVSFELKQCVLCVCVLCVCVCVCVVSCCRSDTVDDSSALNLLRPFSPPLNSVKLNIPKH